MPGRNGAAGGKKNAHAYVPVIPAKAGTHVDFRAGARWVPAFAGMTKPIQESRFTRRRLRMPGKLQPFTFQVVGSNPTRASGSSVG
jgi:hypothetical protein